MKLLTKHTDYATRALAHLAHAEKNGFISAREIAKAQHIPYQFLRRILRTLLQAGLIASKEGGSGGVRLLHDPHTIKVSDVIRLFQGELQLSECLFRGKLCDQRSTCVMRKEIKRIEKMVSDEFEKITIGSLIREREN